MFNINQQILVEKSSFICRNSTFFHNNIQNMQIMNYLKNILLDSAPLTECPDYNDLMEEIKNSKTKNFKQTSYYYSLETLFAIINFVRDRYIYLDLQAKDSQIETLRLYIKYISAQAQGKIYYSEQNMVLLDKNKIYSILNEDKRIAKEKKKLRK